MRVCAGNQPCLRSTGTTELISVGKQTLVEGETVIYDGVPCELDFPRVGTVVVWVALSIASERRSADAHCWFPVLRSFSERCFAL
jgi:hypothetical protein